MHENNAVFGPRSPVLESRGNMAQILDEAMTKRLGVMIGRSFYVTLRSGSHNILPGLPSFPFLCIIEYHVFGASPSENSGSGVLTGARYVHSGEHCNTLCRLHVPLQTPNQGFPHMHKRPIATL